LLALLLRQLQSLQRSDTTYATDHAQYLQQIERHIERLVQPNVLGG
jgi:hypothetical protein